MTPDEARQLVGLEGSFSAEELEAACRRRCQELEAKIERAPTPGLKEKYRRTLTQMEEAWEMLSGTSGEGAEGNFPSLHPVGNTPSIATTPFSDAPSSQKLPPPQPEGSRGFPLFAILGAALVLMGGAVWGYYYGVLVPREQERQAEIAKQEAIQKEKEVEARTEADAVEKARLEAEAQKAAAAAEALRTQQEKARQESERLANARGGLIIKTDPEGATVTLGGEDAQTSPAMFKSIKLGTYPLHVTLDDYEAFDQTAEIKENQFADLGTITLVHSKGSIRVESDPPDLDFTVGKNGVVVSSGKTPCTVPDLPTALYDVAVRKGEWEIKDSVRVLRNQTSKYSPKFIMGAVTIVSEPSGADVIQGGKQIGKTPLKLDDVPAGDITYTVQLDGFKSSKLMAHVDGNGLTALKVSLKKEDSIWSKNSNLYDALSLAQASVDRGIRSHIISVYGIGSATRISTWYFIFFDPSAQSHGQAVKIDDGEVSKTYEANGGVVYDGAKSFSAASLPKEDTALAMANSYAANRSIDYNKVHLLFKQQDHGYGLRWRVSLYNGNVASDTFYASP